MGRDPANRADDPFEGLNLDEAFVQGATYREPSASERVEHPDPVIDLRQGRLDLQTTHRTHGSTVTRPRLKAKGRFSKPWAILVLAVLGVSFLWSRHRDERETRTALSPPVTAEAQVAIEEPVTAPPPHPGRVEPIPSPVGEAGAPVSPQSDEDTVSTEPPARTTEQPVELVKAGADAPDPVRPDPVTNDVAPELAVGGGDPLVVTGGTVASGGTGPVSRAPVRAPGLDDDDRSTDRVARDRDDRPKLDDKKAPVRDPRRCREGGRERSEPAAAKSEARGRERCADSARLATRARA